MIKPDDSAFPTTPLSERGMDLRTYIATQVLAAYTSAMATGAPDEVAKWAIDRADALIAALNKKP